MVFEEDGSNLHCLLEDLEVVEWVVREGVGVIIEDLVEEASKSRVLDHPLLQVLVGIAIVVLLLVVVGVEGGADGAMVTDEWLLV